MYVSVCHQLYIYIYTNLTYSYYKAVLLVEPAKQDVNYFENNMQLSIIQDDEKKVEIDNPKPRLE